MISFIQHKIFALMFLSFALEESRLELNIPSFSLEANFVGGT
jgi:hypothetical protein